MTLLIIFAKEPRPGQVKTRLCPPLAGEVAARLYQCFLEDILEEMARVPGLNLALAYTPDTARDFFQELTPAGFSLFPQADADLGERLAQAFDQGFAGGFKTVLVRNSDSPDLPGKLVLAAAQALESKQADLVLGPSPDGGYYLVGLQARRPELFQEMAWSTPGVLPETLSRAARLSLAVHLLPHWPDIDTLADLQAFLKRRPLPGAPGRRTHLYAQKLLAG
ncbi:MAG: TIGR04282 family arsenosugar biosynthesis glycosyltransferase [Thermodesulfobacteriota bacterium]